ncbi:MAG: bi-domain-containing oxidoreductase [Gammaproteobacteria bacterium]|nr:bi-domain-containing oxidoreductase [Gammaproteobacteria bacterium]
MKQILQNLSNGKTSLADVPCPKCTKGSLLIASRNTLVSVGTERMLVDFGKASMLDKARQQPDKVKMVLDKVKTDGLLPTIDAIRSKLDQPLPLGYCNAGVVLESRVEGFEIGDRVVSNGNHAEVVIVPQNLCAKIPDEVDDESAAFTVLAAIGLQGIRLVSPTLGETVVVSGLGLIGLMTVQMLRANGCRVLGVDFNSARCEMARQYGAETVDLSKGEDPISVAQAFSRGRGVDAVIVAAATQSDEVMHQAAVMCRKRGRIVLVGVVGLNLRRDDFFKKEITFQVSASYGPGRYDSLYEEKGQDYPVGFVRWTEQRNFEAVLDMMASGTLDVKQLISHRFSIENVVEAYGLLGEPNALGILLEYPKQDEITLRKSVVTISDDDNHTYANTNIDPVVGFIGAGNYASRTLIPAFKEAGAKLDTLVTSGGISGIHHGQKAGFLTAATELDELWENKEINTVAIVTRHDAHASQVLAAVEAGKHVFVEKPLALKLAEIDAIDKAFQKINENRTEPLRLMVGFNRRFAPHVVKMKSLLESKREPKVIVITVNAGSIPGDHWTQDPEVGGGRIIGEGCHFIDLMRFLVGNVIINYQAMMIGNVPGVEVRDDKVTINLSFSDGSIGSIHYLANGGKAFPKERVEVFCGDAVLQMDNYRILQGFGWPGFKKMKLFKQDKGQNTCAKAFVDAIKQGKPSPISYNEVMESSRISIEIAESLRHS